MINYNLLDEVNYIRHNQDGVSEGTAILQGIGLDADNRTIVLLKDEDGKSFNASIHCLNQTDEFKARYREAIAQVTKLATDGDAASKALVAEYNDKIQEIYNTIYGEKSDDNQEDSQEAA